MTSGEAIYDRIVYVRSYYATQEPQDKKKERERGKGAVVIQKEKEENKRERDNRSEYN